MLPTIASIAGLLYHNWLRFGDPMQFGYGGQAFDHNPLLGMAGLLFSPGKSVFLYAPPLLLSLISFPRFYRRFPALAQSLLLAAGIALPFYGAWWAWDGGWSWAARFLVPLLPLWVLVMGIALENWKTYAPWQRSGILALILAGLLINGAGVLTDVNQHYTAIGDRDVVNYTFRDAPYTGAWRQLLHGETIPLAVLHLRDLGWTPAAAMTLPALLITMIIWALVILAKGLLHELHKI